jgi:hypothetical protein
MTPFKHPTIPYGLCQCGCGRSTRITAHGVSLYVPGHQARSNRHHHLKTLANRMRPVPTVIDGEKCLYIPLGRLGQYAIINEEDWPLIKDECWHWSGGYAQRNNRPIDILAHRPGTARGTTKMHRVIHPSPPGFVTDHINGNKSDNRRKNLRTITFSQNGVNKFPLRGKQANTSGYPGISPHKQGGKWDGKWTVRISVDKVPTYLGIYRSFDKALEVRKRAEQEHYGGVVPRGV